MKYKTFCRIDMKIMSTLVELEKLNIFLVFPISSGVDITIYQHGKCLYLIVKYINVHEIYNK